MLVLDEPTASLDVRHEMELLELIRRLVDEGLAGLVITHQLNLAARFADRMLLLSDGRVVAEGAPSEVLVETIAEPGVRMAGGGHHLVRWLAAGGAASARGAAPVKSGQSGCRPRVCRR